MSTLVPKLRLSGFKMNWKQNALGKLADMSSGGTPRRKENSYWNGDIPWVTTAEVASQSIIKQTSELITEQGLVNSSAKLFPINTILIALYGQGKTRGKAAMLGIRASTNQACLGILPNDNINSYFIYHYLNQNYEKLRSMANSGSQQNLSMAIVKDVMISYPSLLEQQKIASFFTLLDQKIVKQQEKIEQLKEMKKGMMQKVFLREVRFKDENGEEFPVWQETTFHEVSEIRRGASPRPIANPKWFCKKSKVGWLRIADVTASHVYVEEVTQYLSDEGISKSVLLEEPHLILSIAATVGKPIINNIPLCIHDGFIVFKNLKLNMLFGYYFLEHFEDRWKQFRQPGSQFNLNSDLVGDLNIKIPCKEEQGKIAELFSKIDSKISKERSKLIELEEQKNGLMQQMFV